MRPYNRVTHLQKGLATMTDFRCHAPIAVFLFLLCFFASTSHAGEQKITIRDYTGRGFAPDLVEYNINAPAKTWEALRLVGEDGKQIPCQVRPGNEKGVGVLQFVASLPANGVFACTVKDSGGERAAGGTSSVKEGENLVLSSSVLAVRVPGEIDKKFDPAVAASTLPAPILAFRNAGGNWLGKSKVLSDRKVKAMHVKLVNNGSVCVELSYELEWAEGGFYRATVQVIDQLPLAKIREEYDLNKLDGTDFWELDLASGWKPDTAQTASNNGNGAGDADGRTVDFAKLTQGKTQHIVCDQAWGKLSHLGIFVDAEAKASPKAYPFAGVVPLRKGNWRRSNALEVRSDNANDMRVRFPMSARYAVWPRDITSETSPFSTQENDPSLPVSYGRRVWGLALAQPALAIAPLGKPVYQLQKLYGIIGLDRYKDFILDWPDAKPTFPRLYAGSTPGDADACITTLKTACLYYFSSTCASHHNTAANYIYAAQADGVLSRADLAPEKRAHIRSLLALLTYLYEDGDMMSYANGHHHGNPNMGTARFWSGPCFMALLPDHPLFTAWRDHMAAYGEYNIGTQVAPGGSYLEYGAAYHMHGFARTTNGVPGLKSAGATNVDRLNANYLAPDWRYYMNLLTPFDSRWGSRIIPGMANSQPGNTEHFAEAAGALASMPDLSANLAWAWEANGSKKNFNGPLAASKNKPVEPALTSAIYPGMGVIFRAHQGPAETYMLFRAGFQWSHWTEDPGHFILYSKGACLVPHQPFQYGGLSDKGFDATNTIRFGHPENMWPHGWGDSNILDHTFGKSVDYAWASTGFPDWFIKPGVSPAWQNAVGLGEAGPRKLDATPGQVEGAFEWNRQVMFMKGATAASPNYFVIRDTMPGDGKLASYLALTLLGGKKDVKVNGGHLAVGTEWPTKLEVMFAQPGAAAPEMHEQRQTMALHNSNIGDRIGAPGTVSPNWVKADGSPWEGKPTPATQESRVTLRVAGAPGAGYFWLVYPRGEKEAMPEAKALADGVMKITHAEGTDYVFLGSKEISYEGEGVVFSGLAGAVRVSAKSVTLMKSNGNGKVGYKGRVIAGASPREETFEAGKTGEEKYAKAGDAVGVALEESTGVARFTAKAGEYVKLTLGNKGVRGVGPFDLKFTDTGITGTIDGDERSLAITWPSGVVRPMFKMDGVRYCMGFADDHSLSKGSATPQFSIGFGVTAGKHTVEISEWRYPELPPEPKRRAIDF